MRSALVVLAALAQLATFAAETSAQQSPIQPVVAPALPEDFSSGWYVRGDFGYGMPRIGGGAYAFPLAPGAGGGFGGSSGTVGTGGTGGTGGGPGSASGGGPLPIDPRLANGFGFMGGVGVGFKYNAVRVDFTLDHRFQTSATGIFATPPVGGPTTYSARLSTTATMVNAYWDVFTHAGVTPYVGVGLGAVFASVGARADLANPGVNAVFSGNRTTFAWALMAGLTADITPQVKADFGYRLLGFGGMRFTDAVAGGPVAFGPSLVHEIRLGLRYMFH